jgi:hypothetical protein
VKPLDERTMREFVDRAADVVDGDWVVIGGAVLPLLGEGTRPTLDVDLIPVGEASQSEIIALMEIAEDLGLPVETVNQAGAYFLRKISDYEDHLVLLHEGKTARIYRPDPTLYVMTKVGRLMESDLEDCLTFLRFARERGEEVDEERLRKRLRDELQQEPFRGRKERLLRLLGAI